MAPLPDNGHYDAAAPLDGGASPAMLGGGDKHFSPTGLEIGVIVGVVSLVLITLVGLFVWRSRKNRDDKLTDPASSVPASAPYEELPSPTSRAHEEREANEPTPPPKDDHASAIKNDDMSSIEQPVPVAPERTAVKWSYWGTVHRSGDRDHGSITRDDNIVVVDRAVRRTLMSLVGLTAWKMNTWRRQPSWRISSHDEPAYVAKITSRPMGAASGVAMPHTEPLVRQQETARPTDPGEERVRGYTRKLARMSTVRGLVSRVGADPGKGYIQGGYG
ncbi:hypothetical protein F4804DRAFT_349366 [Jackrogersella minutella]|nr:hypothetical protein F4804DRAFT_349366 [Jackrogersella minutella]